MNRLTVSLQQSILTLHDRGWSARRIARELGLHRETVGREIDRSKPAKVATGSRSRCEPHRASIAAALAQGLSARRIHQDLVADHGFDGRYNTVKRFVRALVAASPLPFRRIETAPGEQMQVDFGQGAPVIDPTSGKRRRPHLFRATPSFSRKGSRDAAPDCFDWGPVSGNSPRTVWRIESQAEVPNAGLDSPRTGWKIADGSNRG